MKPEIVNAEAKPRRSAGRIHWFVLVGCAAAAVHWGSVVLLVERAGLQPLVANVFGWLLAVGVSFAGHHLRTFRGHGGRLDRTAARFLALSAGGFAINESAYALLLHWGGHRYDLLLAAVLIAVATVTYRLGRSWAFAGTPQE